MRIAIVTFDGFNEIDSFVAYNILNRVDLPDWRVALTAPTDTIASMNGVEVRADQRLSFVHDADAVLFGSGRGTRHVIEDESIMEQIEVQPSRQIIGAQCSGALILYRLGLLQGMPVCTDHRTRPFFQEAGLQTPDQPFSARDGLATAGGCLAAPYLAAWMIARLAGGDEARRALEYVAPMGSEQQFIQDVVSTVARTPDPPDEAADRGDARHSAP